MLLEMHAFTKQVLKYTNFDFTFLKYKAKNW